MSYKEINLRSNGTDTVATEIMYEIAAARADGVELVRFNISIGEDTEESSEMKKIVSSATRLLKNMKQKGSIQFIATPDSFKSGSMESSFLYNKYPELFENSDIRAEDKNYIFVKL